MDPLSALSLSGNIVQFLEFAANLFSETKQVLDNGSTLSSIHLRRVAKEAEDMSQSLAKQLSRSAIAESASSDETVCAQLIQFTGRLLTLT